MDKKQKLIVSGMTVASLLVGAGMAKASQFQMTEPHNGKSIVKNHDGEGSCSDEKKEEKKKKDGEGSCGEGSCQSSLY